MLWAVFGMALLVFIAIRWDVTPWLRQKIDVAIAQQHLDVKYATLERHGLNISLHQVQYNDPRMPQTLLLDDVELSLNILPLLRGNIAADIHIQNDFMDIQSFLSFNNNQLNVRDLDAFGDVEKIQTWLALPLPARAQGQLHIEGSLTMDVYSGIPQSADLTAHWQQAAIHMMSQQYPLGDYTLKTKLAEQTIQWHIMGGKELAIQGQGSIAIATTPLPQWGLEGNIKIQAEKSSPLATLLTDSERNLQLSGNVGHPQWRF